MLSLNLCHTGTKEQNDPMSEDDATGIQAFVTCKYYIAVLFIKPSEPCLGTNSGKG